MRLPRDFHLHPLVLLKVAICKLGLAGVFGLIEFCHRCGRRVNVFWRASPGLWNHVTGMGDGGVRCVRCFDHECRARGLSLMWVPRIESSKDSAGRWHQEPPDPELFPEAARRYQEEQAAAE